MKRLFVSNGFLWFILSLPSLAMVWAFASDPSNAEALLHPSGEFSARLMIVALMISPLRLIFPHAIWLHWLSRRRRYLGVAAFAYALLHTVFYVYAMGALQPMLDEFWALGIWSGWAAFAIFIPLALTSNNASQRWLMSQWKMLQRWVYPAAVLTLIHWIFVHNNLGPALVHFVPLLLLQCYRIWKNTQETSETTSVSS